SHVAVARAGRLGARRVRAGRRREGTRARARRERADGRHDVHGPRLERCRVHQHRRTNRSRAAWTGRRGYGSRRYARRVHEPETGGTVGRAANAGRAAAHAVRTANSARAANAGPDDSVMRAGIGLPCAASRLALLAGCGITGNLRLNPGYASFSPGLFDSDTNRELGLSLGVLPLRIAKAIVRDDPEIAGILGDLKAVRVYIYEVDGDAARVRERIERTHGRLVDRGWQPVVAVRDDGEFATALARVDGPERIRGLAVMLLDSEEVVLINLIGDIRPETFGAVMAQMDVQLPETRVQL